MKATLKATLAVGAVAAVVLASVVPPAEAGGSAPALLAQRSRGRGGGRGAGSTPADARSVVRGHIISIDTAAGRVALDVEGTVLEATFPPTRLREMKAGDVVFVTVALIDTRIAAISGSVTAVDPQKGTLTVATPRGALTVTSSPETVATIKPGDNVLLKLDVVDIGPPFEPSMPPAGDTQRSDAVR